MAVTQIHHCAHPHAFMRSCPLLRVDNLHRAVGKPNAFTTCVTVDAFCRAIRKLDFSSAVGKVALHLARHELEHLDLGGECRLCCIGGSVLVNDSAV